MNNDNVMPDDTKEFRVEGKIEMTIYIDGPQ